ncbi:hypothetical protein GCM10008955_01400 [Deinococcus malanensis]|uniref:Uncharacterized protein n=1 Tax=Deinococcus malanensis TaxID=1706855 RepID=A0ABQ2EJK2_9DEIO|nr:hypothetical protein [Deinococcus malanensis]GGK11873.1 hypothetical protein GCM10008955_01400 [Deinococcus malanensis]
MTSSIQKNRHERFLEWDEVELPAEDSPQDDLHHGNAHENQPSGLFYRLTQSLLGKRQLSEV